jgi:exopolysaccharide biosynthesis polyprenyl glycosylphosphotransferase
LKVHRIHSSALSASENSEASTRAPASGARPPQPHKLRRILIAGTGRIAVTVAQTLVAKGAPITLAGSVDSAPQNQLIREFPDVPTLGGFDGLREILIGHCIDELHVALPLKACSDLIDELRSAAHDVGVPLIVHLDLFEFPGPEAVRVGNRGLTVASGVHPSVKGLGRVVKRAMDVLIASTVVVALSPLYLGIAAAIKLTSPGPVFFRQERVGRGQRIFGMIKFRSMVPNAEDLRSEVAGMNNARGISFKIFNDPRVTRVGSVLRRTSLDELPQLFNVIAGDMSLVGPRPIPVWVLEQLKEARYYRRFCVQPGLTGLWQVEGRQQDFDWMATQDLRYVDNWSIPKDLKILLATIPAVVRGEGAH